MASAQFTFRVNSGSKGARSAGKSRGTGMFCSVCKSAGKSEAEYTSHFVRENRDPNSRVVCPILLATECRYCKGIGHTKSHCPILKRRNEQRSQQKDSGIVFRTERKQTTLGDAVKRDIPQVCSKHENKWMKKHSQNIHKAQLSTTKSRFAALDSDDEEEETSSIRKEEFPSLGGDSAARIDPLSYRKVIDCAPVHEAKRVEEKKPEKKVTFSLPKIAKEQPVEQVTFDFADDFVDWADEAEESQDAYQLETPEWAKSQEEKDAEKQKEIQSSVAQLQYEMCDGWE
jgi:hypothetical protein